MKVEMIEKAPEFQITLTEDEASILAALLGGIEGDDCGGDDVYDFVEELFSELEDELGYSNDFNELFDGHVKTRAWADAEENL